MKGYCCKVDGELIGRTLFDTERGAMANGLLVLFNVMPTQSWTDEMIKEKWDWCCSTAEKTLNRHASVVEVLVTEVT